MAILQITVPNALVPELVTIASNALTYKDIDISGMSNVQISQKYIVEFLREALINYREQQANAAALVEFNNALKEKKSLLSISKQNAKEDALGITG